VLLLPALCKSILLVASNSRQLTNSMPGVCSGVIVSEYEFLSRHSTSQSSSSTVEPINNVRMTRSHFALLSWSRYVNVSFRWSSLSPNSASLTQFCAVACDEVRAHSRAVNSRRIIGARHLVPTTQSSIFAERGRSRPRPARSMRCGGAALSARKSQTTHRPFNHLLKTGVPGSRLKSSGGMGPATGKSGWVGSPQRHKTKGSERL